MWICMGMAERGGSVQTMALGVARVAEVHLGSRGIDLLRTAGLLERYTVLARYRAEILDGVGQQHLRVRRASPHKRQQHSGIPRDRLGTRGWDWR
mmetsp:Transcript_65716/g.130160  ORF Transcript_65716/g.130160 Transcript_65716/m.130160 type:complete len:95 (+) Transcript_65716:153-437(+)